MRCEERSGPAVLRDAKALEIHRTERLRNDGSALDARKWNTDYRRTHLVGTPKNICRYIKTVTANREIGEIHEGTVDIQDARRDVKQAPSALNHIGDGSEREALNVVASVGPILHKPDECIDFAYILDHLIAAKVCTRWVGVWEGGGGIDKAEGLAAI